MALLGQYAYVIDRTHPRANEDGAVYLHVIISEQTLGRYLLPEEVVHHKDLDKLNNHPDNLMVFATKGDHTRFHMCDCDEQTLTLNPNGAYVCSGRQFVCVDCGAVITYGSKRCRGCANKANRKTDRPTANELLNLLVDIQGNFSAVGKKYGVSDNAIRKWCDLYGLSRKSRDYRQHN